MRVLQFASQRRRRSLWKATAANGDNARSSSPDAEERLVEGEEVERFGLSASLRWSWRHYFWAFLLIMLVAYTPQTLLLIIIKASTLLAQDMSARLIF